MLGFTSEATEKLCEDVLVSNTILRYRRKIVFRIKRLELKELVFTTHCCELGKA